NGKRTWGGLVAAFAIPPLMDGGLLSAPHAAIYGLRGDCEPENRRVAPDVEVEFDPAERRHGRAAHLERSIQCVLEDVKQNLRETHQRPEFANYHKERAN